MGSLAQRRRRPSFTVGGDDVWYKSFVTSCLTVGCRRGSLAYSTIEGHIQNDLPGELSSFFGTLEKDYTASKRVLVLGYPRLLPLTSSSFTCSDLSSGSRISGAMQVETDLNGAISAAVTCARSPFEFVDADAVLDNVREPRFAGHELCSSDPDFNAGSAYTQSTSRTPTLRDRWRTRRSSRSTLYPTTRRHHNKKERV